MKHNKSISAALLALWIGALSPYNCLAKPDASVKSKAIRLENKNPGKEVLILPYAFPSDSMGATGGVGGLAKGYGQEQLIIGATVFGSADDARGIMAGMWDYRLPWTDRFYFSSVGAISHYPRQHAYTEVPRRPDGLIPPQVGTNNSNKNNFAEDEGSDNWYDLRLEYVLPIGSMQSTSIANYSLKNGILESGATGGGTWNPLTSGVSILLLGQSGRYQSYETDTVTYDGDTFPFQFNYSFRGKWM